jgi:uncharacterized membrane protein YfcA
MSVTGALIGSIIGQWLPKEVFPWLLVITCPLILTMIWQKELWVSRALHPGSASRLAIALAGLGAGIYDGAWGPGGGTIMFLALLYFARLPLLTALAASKLSNTAAAIVGLVSYGIGGHVHVHQGLMLGLGMLIGSFFGANLASTNAARVVRPALLVVVVLLAARVIAVYA